MDEQVELFVDKLKAVTELAALCEIEGKEFWIPLSQMDDNSEIKDVGDDGVIWIPEWLALDKDIPY